MLKSLVVFGLVFVSVTPAFSPVLGQAPNSPTPNGQEQKNDRKGDKNPTPPTPPVIGQDKGSRIKEAESKETPTDYEHPTINVTNPAPVTESWSWHDKIAWGAGLLLLVVGTVTLWWFIIQTIATKETAEATLLNVKALIISERPWIVVELRSQMDGSNWIHTLNFANRGRTPAELIEIHCTYEVQPFESFTPPEDLNCPLTHPTQTLFFADNLVKIYDVYPQGLLDADKMSADGPNTVYVYGRIRYWDKFTDRKKPGVEPYLTQWCFHYIPARADTLDCFVLTPNGYNKHT